MLKTIFKVLFTTMTGKGVVAIAAGVLAAAAFITMPPVVIAVASGISTVATFYGIDTAHKAPPPVKKVD